MKNLSFGYLIFLPFLLGHARLVLPWINRAISASPRPRVRVAGYSAFALEWLIGC